MSRRPFVKNAADRKQVEEAKKKERNERNQEIEDIRFVLSDARGRRFFWRYLGECGVFKTSMTGNSQTFFNEGMRNIGLKLLADLNEADPGAYIKMMNENKEDGGKDDDGRSDDPDRTD